MIIKYRSKTEFKILSTNIVLDLVTSTKLRHIVLFREKFTKENSANIEHDVMAPCVLVGVFHVTN